MQHLQRKLGLWSCISIVAGAVIGSSIFMKPATMAGQLGSPGLLLLVWVVAGVVSLFGAMINAEIGSAMPQTGGQYVYFRYLYGDFFAFLYGWAGFIVINTAAISGIAFVFAHYAGYFFQMPHFSREVEQGVSIVVPFIGRFYLLEHIGTKLLAIAVIVGITLMNSLSVKSSGTFQVFFTVIKVMSLVFLVGAIFISDKGNIQNLYKNPPSFNPSFWISITSFITASTGALAAYDGWNNLGFVAGEIKNPQKNIPRGLIIGLGLCIILYVLTTEAYLYVLPVDTMKNATLVASDALQHCYGLAGGALIVFLVLISTAGATNGNILPCARVTFAMSQENNFFAFAGRINPRFQTPANALWLQAGWAIVLVFIGSFDMLMDMFVFITWIFYGFMAYGIFIFRKKFTLIQKPFVMHGFPVLPIIFILFTVLYVAITLFNEISNFITGKSEIINSVLGLTLTAMGIPLYWYFKRKKLNKH